MFAATVYRKDGEIEAVTEYIFSTDISDHPQSDEEVK
jgi:hypothetical protein